MFIKWYFSLFNVQITANAYGGYQMELDRRTKRTKKLLTDAFITLLSTKNLNEITIKELCDTADINRGTFYLHYQDLFF